MSTSYPGRRRRIPHGALLVAALALACSNDATGPSTAAPSAAASRLIVSRDTILAGTSVELTLEARDSSGHPLGEGGATVAFAASGGSSDGTMDATRDPGDGSYHATFTGRIAGTATTITATINGEPVTTPLPTVAVQPGPLDPGLSPVSVTPRTIEINGSATLQLRTRDKFGNDLTRGGSTVVFSATDGTGKGSIGPTTDVGDGTYEATFTGSAVGTPLTIGASVDGVPVTSPAPLLSVSPGPSSEFSTLEVSTDTIPLGGAATLTVTVRDSAGNLRGIGGAEVTFTVASGTGVSAGTVDTTTDLENGTYTTTFTGEAAGTAVTLSAAIDGRPVSSTVQITVLPAPISLQNASISADASSVVAGTNATFLLTLRDLDSNAVAEPGHAVTFTLEDGSSGGTIGPVSYQPDGTYQATFTGLVAGTPVTVGAMVDDSSRVQMLDGDGVSHLPTMTVTPAPLFPDSATVTAVPNRLAVGAASQLRLSGRDAWGNATTSGGRTVVFLRSGGVGVSDGTIGPATDHGDGTWTASYVATAPGKPDTILATIDGVPVPGPGPTILVGCVAGPVSPGRSQVTVNDSTANESPGKSAAVASGTATTVNLDIRDALDCPVTNPLAVTFTVLGGTGTAVIGTPADEGDGTWHATVTGVLAGPVVLGATINGVSVSSSPATLNVVPGDVSAQTSTVTASRSAIDSGGVSIVRMQGRDAAGNVLVTGGRSVLFSASGGLSAGVIGPVTDHGDGTWSATFTGTAAAPGSPAQVQASVDGTPLTTAPASIDVVAGTIDPANSTLNLIPPGNTLAAGDTLGFRLDARDASGRHLVGGGRSVVFSVGGGTSDGALIQSPDPDDGTYLARFLGTTAGTAITVGATIDGSVVTSPAPSFSVVAGPLVPAASRVTVSAPTVAVGGIVDITLQATDAFGNAVPATGLSVVFTASTGAGTSTGVIGPVTDKGDGTYTASFTGVSAGTPATISSTVNGVPVSTPQPTIVVQ